MRALVLVVAALLPVSAACEPAVEARVPATASTAAPGPGAPPAARPWLGPPWTLQSAATVDWPAGRPAGYTFCGQAWSPAAGVRGVEQTLVDASGRRTRLLALQGGPRGDSAVQVFKRSYADCLERGEVESLPGPRNVWRTGTGAAGSELRDDVVRVLDLPGEGPAVRDEVVRLLDAWAD